MSWVDVIPKEGRMHVAALALLLVWQRLVRIFWKKKILFKNFWYFFLFFLSRCHTRAPVLLVWQWIRTLGTFLHNATHFSLQYFIIYPCFVLHSYRPCTGWGTIKKWRKGSNIIVRSVKVAPTYMKKKSKIISRYYKALNVRPHPPPPKKKNEDTQK